MLKNKTNIKKENKNLSRFQILNNQPTIRLPKTAAETHASRSDRRPLQKPHQQIWPPTTADAARLKPEPTQSHHFRLKPQRPPEAARPSNLRQNLVEIPNLIQIYARTVEIPDVADHRRVALQTGRRNPDATSQHWPAAPKPNPQEETLLMQNKRKMKPERLAARVCQL